MEWPSANPRLHHSEFMADRLLVDGNPLENIDLIADPAKKFVVIIKDGKICKNKL